METKKQSRFRIIVKDLLEKNPNGKIESRTTTIYDSGKLKTVTLDQFVNVLRQKIEEINLDGSKK